jgi:predicted AAA+ superfamily ATPase
MAELEELLVRLNPWWRGKAVEGIAGLRPRFLYQRLLEQMKNKQIIAITGPRRTGKSTLMRHLIQHLLNEGTKPTDIMYFSFDEVLARDPEVIEKVLITYERSFLMRELRDVFIFLDEVQYIENWAAILKRYYDLDVGIKFVISGSQSLAVKKGGESLAGRIYEFQLPPLSFREFLYLAGEEENKVSLELERLEETKKRLLLKKGQILAALSRYLRQGSFPELIREENVENARQYVASLLKKVIFEDIPMVFPIENPALLNEMLKLIAKRPGMLLEYQSLASSLGMTRQTASKYISILEEAYLVRILANYRKSDLAVARKAKKAYLVAHAYALPFIDLEEVLARPSWLVENVIACHLDARFFWRNSGEVDFVVNGEPIEVKSGEGENLKWVTKFMKKFSAERGIVVTEDTLERKIVDADGKKLEVLLVPLWLFLLSF